MKLGHSSSKQRTLVMTTIKNVITLLHFLNVTFPNNLESSSAQKYNLEDTHINFFGKANTATLMQHNDIFQKTTNCTWYSCCGGGWLGNGGWPGRKLV